jgi:hypothetical protein
VASLDADHKADLPLAGVVFRDESAVLEQRLLGPATTEVSADYD